MKRSFLQIGLLVAGTAVKVVQVVAATPTTSGALLRRQHHSRSSHSRHLQNDALICHVTRLLTRNEAEGGDSISTSSTSVGDLLCDILNFGSFINDSFLRIDLPPEFVSANAAGLDQGRLVVSIPGGYPNRDYSECLGYFATDVVIPDNSTLTVLDAADWLDTRRRRQRRRRHRRRRTQDSNNNATIYNPARPKIMIVKVATDDSSVNASSQAIADAVFDDFTYSLRSQLHQCTFGQVTVQPYHTVFPVTDITLQNRVASCYTPLQMVAAAETAVAERINEATYGVADFVIYCLPPGIQGDTFVATAAVGNHFMIVYDSYCTNPNVMLHELGHGLLKLGHAYHNNDEYGDSTSLMGAATSRVDGPARCYNGLQYWRLMPTFMPDYMAQAVEITAADGLHRVELAALTDAGVARPEQALVLKVNNVFLVYNRMETFNAETGEYGNQITVTSAYDGSSASVSGIHSNLLGALDAHNQTRFAFAAPFGTMPLQIQVCDRIDSANSSTTTADVFVLAIGTDREPCEATVAPTPAPVETYQPVHVEFDTDYDTSPPTSVEDRLVEGDDMLAARNNSAVPTMVPVAVLIQAPTVAPSRALDVQDIEPAPAPGDSNSDDADDATTAPVVKTGTTTTTTTSSSSSAPIGTTALVAITGVAAAVSLAALLTVTILLTRRRRKNGRRPLRHVLWRDSADNESRSDAEKFGVPTTIFTNETSATTETDWDCPQCTLCNADELQRCAACRCPKPQSAQHDANLLQFNPDALPSRLEW